MALFSRSQHSRGKVVRAQCGPPNRSGSSRAAPAVAEASSRTERKYLLLPREQNGSILWATCSLWDTLDDPMEEHQ